MNNSFVLAYKRATTTTVAVDHYGNDHWGATVVEDLVDTAIRGLALMRTPHAAGFVQTVRRDPAAPSGVRGEGDNIRYAAIVALGVARLDDAARTEVLGGGTLAALVGAAADRAAVSTDLGAVATAAWACAEVTGAVPEAMVRRLVDAATSTAPVPTVDLAWTLTALLAAGGADDAASVVADRLRAAQGPTGLFPHALPRDTLGRLRAHVGCFADQVYPIQALSRYFARTGDTRALAAADRCADRIVELQGSAGQWWWHYDMRTGDVVEGYPVYSVHQHAMAPMALFELAEAGGNDHTDAVMLGLDWLRTHPETTGELVDPAIGVIWRKVGRREPRKLARAVRAASTAVRPGLRLRALDVVVPAGRIDHECRPYELGWLLYAWTSVRAATSSAEHGGPW